MSNCSIQNCVEVFQNCHTSFLFLKKLFLLSLNRGRKAKGQECYKLNGFCPLLHARSHNISIFGDFFPAKHVLSHPFGSYVTENGAGTISSDEIFQRCLKDFENREYFLSLSPSHLSDSSHCFVTFSWPPYHCEKSSKNARFPPWIVSLDVSESASLSVARF